MRVKTRAPLTALAAVVMLFALAATAAQAQVTTLRVMLHPYLAAAGTFPPAAQAKVNALAGMPLAATGFTRTGAVILVAPTALAAADLKALLSRLRNDRDIVWADLPPVAGVTKATSTAAATAAAQIGTNFMVKLASPAAPDWGTVLPQLANAIGAPIAPVRQIGDVWVMQLLQAQTLGRMSAMAAAMQTLPSVQFADPVHRVRTMVTPNDPYFTQQWSLTNAASGINIQAAWAITTGTTPSITVGVIDTGITPHPDLDGRVLAGYDFISDPDEARDGDGRDPNPLDQGDWTSANQCGDGAPAEPSFWHGTFVSGLIAANSNNGVGIAGINWGAQILPVRALGVCGGTNQDVFEAMMWASGLPIDGVPDNPNPARVINMSLGGYGACDGATQEAVDMAMAQGAVVVVSAGNATDDAQNYSPANCSGVITVGAAGITGNLASYSNFGTRVDITAPGGDFDDGDTGLMISTFNSGTTVPVDAAYGIGAGTSFSAPMVSGTVSLMLSRNANLTAGRILGILQGTTRVFPSGSPCNIGNLCGTGLLDAGAALASTSSDIPPLNAVAVIEYYRADLDHYFITASPSEISYYDTVLSGIYQRTGEVFFAYPTGAVAPPGALPVCRYEAGGLINSNFYSADADECAAVAANTANGWTLDTNSAFWIEVADSEGNCADNHVPVYRFFNNRRDANQRFTSDLSVRRTMLNRSWVLDAPTPNGAVFCAPT